MSLALGQTGEPVQLVYVVQTSPNAPDALAVLHGETAGQVCILVFNERETAQAFCSEYRDAGAHWLPVPVALSYLLELLQNQANNGRTHVMIDAQVNAGPLAFANVVPIMDYVASINQQ